MQEEMPNDWQAPVDPRPRYRLCRVGFALGAFGLGLLALDAAGHSFAFLSQDRALDAFLSTPLWDWLVGMPITWGSFLGSILLLGRFPDARWRRRSILLAVMNSVDLAHWCADHAEVLGLPDAFAGVGHHPFRFVFGIIMNLAELVEFAGLANDLGIHLGRESETAPRFVGLRLDGVAFFIGAHVALAVTAALVTVLCAQATVYCHRALADIDRQEKESDPFRGPGDGA